MFRNIILLKLLLLLVFLSSCSSYKRVCYTAVGDASRSNTKISDDSKKNIWQRGGLAKPLLKQTYRY